MTSMQETVELLKVDARGRVRVSEERRDAILDEFGRSGMSGAAFAREHGIKYQTFAAWVRRRRAKDSKAGSPWPAVAEVVIDDHRHLPSSPGQSLRVHLPGNAVLEIHEDDNSLALAVALLNALAKSC